MKIFFLFRVAWRQHCQAETDSYVADCADMKLPPQRIVNQWHHHHHGFLSPILWFLS